MKISLLRVVKTTTYFAFLSIILQVFLVNIIRAGSQIPRRLLYSLDERATNSNIPAPSDQPLRNTYDPGDTW